MACSEPTISLERKKTLSITTDVAETLRSAAVGAVRESGMTYLEIATSLGVFQTAVERMILEPYWPVERSLRILEVLGHQVEMRVS